MCRHLVYCAGVSLLVGLAGVVGLALLQWPRSTECLAACQSSAIRRQGSEEGSKADHCALSAGLSWDDFRKKGYTVVPGFLSKAESDILMGIYSKLQDDSVTNPEGNGGQKQGYRSTWIAGMSVRKQVPEVAERILNLTASACREAGLNIPIPTFEEMFFTTNSSDWSRSLKLDWHQDIENYFFFQDLHNYLDFYLFLRKPDPRQAGVTLVPRDYLSAQSPELHRLTEDRTTAFGFSGAAPGRMVAFDSVRDASYLLNFHLDELGCSPALDEGDLLLFAGDVIHRTQEHSSWRISLNINVHQTITEASLQVRELLRGGMMKYGWMVRNIDPYVNVHITANSLWGSPKQADLLKGLLRTCIGVGFKYRQALTPVRALLNRLLP